MHRSAPGRPNSYIGRFAPSPSGPLHFGSLVTAMASWLDARSVDGVWLVRIEDLDTPRNQPGTDLDIVETLAAYGMVADKPVTWQSHNLPSYWGAIEKLEGAGLLYRCICSRREIAEASLASAGLPVYPGTCRNRLVPIGTRAALRLRVADEQICFIDRRFGSVCQKLAEAVGDFVVRRAEGILTYQLAVVVDDAAQDVTHVVRGADLLDSTPRQIYLQRLLGYTTPRYWHVPVIVNEHGEKLSKQTGAIALQRDDLLPVLRAAAEQLGLVGIGEHSLGSFWKTALLRFREQQSQRLQQHQEQLRLGGQMP